jgi:hypothetical protein
MQLNSRNVGKSAAADSVVVRNSGNCVSFIVVLFLYLFRKCGLCGSSVTTPRLGSHYTSSGVQFILRSEEN